MHLWTVTSPASQPPSTLASQPPSPSVFARKLLGEAGSESASGREIHFFSFTPQSFSDLSLEPCHKRQDFFNHKVHKVHKVKTPSGVEAFSFDKPRQRKNTPSLPSSLCATAKLSAKTGCVLRTFVVQPSWVAGEASFGKVSAEVYKKGCLCEKVPKGIPKGGTWGVQPCDGTRVGHSFIWIRNDVLVYQTTWTFGYWAITLSLDNKAHSLA